MEIDFGEQGIMFQKEPTSLDQFVLDFTAILTQHKIEYVIMSGYVSILFGRSRSSEDVDLFLSHLTERDFSALWAHLTRYFGCLNCNTPHDAYNDYLAQGLAIRFARHGSFIPNMEIKFPKSSIDIWTFENRKKILMNGNALSISRIEVQIAFKLFLGSDKDIEDAKHLYILFKDYLDIELLHDFNRKLKVDELFRKNLE